MKVLYSLIILASLGNFFYSVHIENTAAAFAWFTTCCMAVVTLVCIIVLKHKDLI
jgi:hypothetical protein